MPHIPGHPVGGAGAAARRHGIGGSEAMTLQMLMDIFPEMTIDQIYAMWRPQQTPTQVPPDRDIWAGDPRFREDLYDTSSDPAIEAQKWDPIMGMNLGQGGDREMFERVGLAAEKIYDEQRLGRMQEFEIPIIMRDFMEGRMGSDEFVNVMKTLQVPEREIWQIVADKTGVPLNPAFVATLPPDPEGAEFTTFGLNQLDPLRDRTVSEGAVALEGMTTGDIEARRQAGRDDLKWQFVNTDMSDAEFVAKGEANNMPRAEINALIREKAADPAGGVVLPGADVIDLDPDGQGDVQILGDVNLPPGQDPGGTARWDVEGVVDPLSPREQAFRGMDVGEQYSRFLSGLVGPRGRTGTVAQGLANILGPVMIDPYYGADQVSPFYQAMVAGRPTAEDEAASSYYDFLQQRGARPFTRGELGQQLRDVVASRALGEDVFASPRQQALLGSFRDPGDQFRLFQDYMEQSVAPSARRAAGQAAQDLYAQFRNTQPENQQFLALMQQQGYF